MIVLDTSFLIGFHNALDAHHQAAKVTMEKVIQGEWGKAILAEYVYLEVMTVAMARTGLSLAVEYGDQLLQSKEIEFVSGSDFFMDAMQLFRAQKKPNLSFVDAAIVAIARKYDAKYVATFDEDFRNIQGLQIVPTKR